MEQKFSNNSIDLQVLRKFCEREGEAVSYRKGEQLEREGDPSRWFGFVERGCFKYVNHGISEWLRVGDRRSGIEGVSTCPATSVLSC